ncbi:MAG: D-2-hydroxyacid dehydrogenase [Candidatus Eremiobacteraeota bacterium]|nr:D-2-hydroxyacid dehydrogenase [Candidatus Eremiobacteraeota bacterium]
MRILIATPLEAELAARIAAVDSANEISFVPELMPPARYPSDHRGPANWKRDASAKTRWRELLSRAEIMYGIPGDTGPTLAAALELAPLVRWVQATAAGAGEQVRAAALPQSVLDRIVFTSAAGVHGGMLAEFVFLGILALRKDLRRLERVRSDRAWDHFASGELDGSTIAILGMGHIGTTTARIARGFGMKVIGITRDGAPQTSVDEMFSTARLREAFARADAVVATLPGTEQTRGLVDRGALAALGRQAIFCNVGRGSVVDQDALVEALKSGAIFGAVLDVATPEPLPAENPLWTMPNVVFAPHTMALSVRENERIVDLFCDNLRRYARGEALRNRVNPIEFY